MIDKSQELNDLLNRPLDEVPTDMPLINATAELRLDDIKVSDNKSGDGSNLNCVFGLTTPVQAVSGQMVNPGAYGSKFYHTISLKTTEKYNPAENLARLKQALTGTKAGTFGAPEQYIGSTCMAILKVEKSDQFGDRTTISRFVKKG